MKIEKIGVISKTVIEVLELDIKEDSPILISDGNYRHMKDRHPEDFEKYSLHIPGILKIPDYVGINPKDTSLEYVKEFEINEEFVKVAVRVSGKGIFYVRSMYTFEDAKKFIEKGRLKKLD